MLGAATAPVLRAELTAVPAALLLHAGPAGMALGAALAQGWNQRGHRTGIPHTELVPECLSPSLGITRAGAASAGRFLFLRACVGLKKRSENERLWAPELWKWMGNTTASYNSLKI